MLTREFLQARKANMEHKAWSGWILGDSMKIKHKDVCFCGEKESWHISYTG